MAKAAPSDAELVKKAQAGQREAFGLLVERHQDYVYNSVCYLTGGGQDAEDIAQEVFVSAYRALGRFQGRALFTTWLYGIMLNSVRSYWRRRRKVKVLSVQSGGAGDAGEDDDPAVQAAIAGLDEDLKEIIVLRDIQGLTYEELADALALPDGTVKSRLYRARRELMERLKPYWDAQK